MTALLRRAVPALLVAALPACAAHLPAAGERTAFLERSAVTLSSDRSQSFEVDPAIHLLLWNGLEDGALEEGGFATVGSVSFLGSVRMLHGPSSPIRIPTYEPRARLQLLRAVVLGRGEDAPETGHRLLGGLDLLVGHRSNGQDGCALAGHTRTGRTDFACVADTDPPDQRLNLTTGSFTTNYVGAGTGLAWIAPAARPGAPAAVIAGAASLEWNVPCALGACMPPEMRARYGAAVARGTLDAELPGIWQVAVAGGTPLGLRASVAGTLHAWATARRPFGDASAELALVARPPRALGVGLFVRRHQGSDPLNIRFEERLDAWFVGLSLEPAPLGRAEGRAASRTAPTAREPTEPTEPPRRPGRPYGGPR